MNRALDAHARVVAALRRELKGLSAIDQRALLLTLGRTVAAAAQRVDAHLDELIDVQVTTERELRELPEADRGGA